MAQGHTVFMVSWRNVPEDLGTLTWDDYIEQGALTAIRVAREITGSRTVNALGFCVGGTILACALAVLAARRDASVQSATLLTTMLDFADPGEIGVYVSRELLAAREPQLQGGQRVHGSELAGAFASLRANDLVWNYVVGNYLKGETPPPFDLLYWNGDSANLPGPMYVYYLRNLYLDNRLREPGALTMAGTPVDLSRIRMPVYVYASRDDHIVPWRSAYRTTGARRRRRVVRARIVRAHRGRRQSAAAAAPQLLDQRPRHRLAGRLVRARGVRAGQLVAALGAVARGPRRARRTRRRARRAATCTRRSSPRRAATCGRRLRVRPSR